MPSPAVEKRQVEISLREYAKVRNRLSKLEFRIQQLEKAVGLQLRPGELERMMKLSQRRSRADQPA